MDKGRVGLIVFVGAYMLGLGGLAFYRGNNEFLFYGVIMLLLIGGVLALDRRVHLSQPVLWGLALWGLMHMAGGNVPIGGEKVLYNWRPVEWLPKYDQATHAFGFFVATFTMWEAVRAAIGVPVRVGVGLAVALFTTGMGLGAVNEVVEFAAVLALPETNVGGYMNTGWDLVSNMVGASLAAAILWWRGRDDGSRPAQPVGVGRRD